MDLSYSEEQRLLKESVDRFVRQEYNFEQRRRVAESEEGFSRDNWRTFAELGWLAVPFSEENGGLGGGPVEIMIMMEAFGKGLVLEPWLSSVIMSGVALEKVANTEQKNALTAIIQGELLCSVAHWEPNQGFNPEQISTTAEKTAQGYVLDGHKSFVLNGQAANQLIVSAKLSSENAIGLFLLDSSQVGVRVRGFNTLENGRAANIQLDQVQVSEDQLLAKGDAALDAIRAIEQLATFAICAEAVGIMEVLYKTTVEYAKTRKQFGLPIGKFQALQHRMVNMFILHEQSQSLLLMAAIKLQEGGEQAEQAVAALKTWVGQAGRKIGQEAVQLHGGMGMTDELDVGYYFKRITAIDALFGAADVHLDQYATRLR